MSSPSLFCCLALLALVGADCSSSHRVEHLSEARRDIGVAFAGGKAYFAGGCKDDTGGWAYVCDKATATVDIFTAKGPSGTATLGEARGWPSGCAVGSKVVFAGGGTGGQVPHSSAADVFDVSTGAASHETYALSSGRWGLGCATMEDTIYFAGGKIVYDSKRYEFSDVVDLFRNGTWGSAPFRLSQPRESVGAAVGHGSLIVVGGWVLTNTGGYSVDTVDVFSKGGAATAHLSSKAYLPGIAAALTGDIYVVGNKQLDRFDGSTWVSSALPDDMTSSTSGSLEDGGAVPAAHVPNNGVAVGDLVCFYGWQSKKSSAVYCYHTIEATWSLAMKCSVSHRAGAIAVIGKTVLVAGGYDPDNNNMPTDIVDIFEFDGSSKMVVV